VLQPPHNHVHQGAVYIHVPVIWVPHPLWVMRPKDRRYEDAEPRLADELTDLFVGQDGREVILAQAKARPVVVLSTFAELRRLRQVRVVPLYSYRLSSAVARLRGEIEDGRVGSAFHLAGEDALGIHDGALRLDQAQPVDGDFLIRQAASLSDAAFAALTEHMARYVRVLDRRPAS
jgi:hypothetical protein